MDNSHDKIMRWPWYYIEIIANVAFIILDTVTRLPGGSITGKGGDIDANDIEYELALIV